MELSILLLENKEHWDGDSLMNECVFVRFALSAVCELKNGDRELFGPILPILPVDDLNEAIQFVSGRCVTFSSSPLFKSYSVTSIRDHPLVLYAFCASEEAKNAGTPPSSLSKSPNKSEFRHEYSPTKHNERKYSIQRYISTTCTYVPLLPSQ
jgi:hypothetical protein